MTRTRIGKMALATMIALTPAAASATDWWWVAGDPGSSDAWFVDVDTLSTLGSEVSFQLLHITRDRGSALPQRRRADCAGTVDGEPDWTIQKFVCATPEERMSLGAMLGPIAPEVAANAIFDGDAPAMANR